MDKLIIALVVVIAVAAHVILYRWVKFKIDEGVVQQFMRDANDEGLPNCHSAETIADHTGLALARVNSVCIRSNSMTPVGDNWQLV